MSLIGREVYESVSLLRVLALTDAAETAAVPEPAELLARGALDPRDELAERPPR